MARVGAGLSASGSSLAGPGLRGSAASGARLNASASAPRLAGASATAAASGKAGLGSAAAGAGFGAAAPGVPGAGVLASAVGTTGLGANASASASASAGAAAATELTTLLKHKSGVTRGYSANQLDAYNKQMLSTVQDLEPLVSSRTDRLTLAAAVPGALGKLPPGSEELSSASNDAELTTLQMQQALQKQQQIMQTMSNISKQAHDTLKATINNIRA